MLLLRFVVWIFSVGSMILVATAVSSQDYPNKPIRIVTSTAGGSADFVSRLIAQGLSGSLGQQAIVDNRGDHITMEIVGKAPPDGYTVLITGAGFFIEPLFRTVSYDPVRDFSPITLAVSSFSFLVVNPSLAANSVKELIALAKAKPGALNYGSAGAGGAAYLAAELFKGMAGVNIVHIPYKGTGPALTDLIGGRLQLGFAPASVAPPHVNAGRLRALAITSAQPSELAPGLPTVAATLPGYEAVVIVGVYAPAKTPAALINRLNQEIVRVLNQASIKEKLLNTGVEVIGSTPEGLGARMRSEMTKWGKLIKDLGLRADEAARYLGRYGTRDQLPAASAAQWAHGG